MSRPKHLKTIFSLLHFFCLGTILIPKISFCQQVAYDSSSIWGLTLSEFLSRPEQPHADILGGCVSITEGALGTSVIIMALGVSKTHEKDSLKKTLLNSYIDSLKANQKILMNLADQDRLLFGKFLTAYKMPGITTFEKKLKDSVIYFDLLEATESPLESSMTLLTILKILKNAIPVCYRETLSDARASAFLVYGAFNACIAILDDDIMQLRPEDSRKYQRLRNAYYEKSVTLMREISTLSKK